MRYLFLILAFAISVNTFAQEIKIKPYQKVASTISSTIPIDTLSKAYFSGNWEGLIANTEILLSQIYAHVESFPKIEENDYINIIAVDGGNHVVDYIYSADQRNYSNVLKGVSRDNGNFYQLVISDTENDSLSSIYSYEATADPIVSLIPGFVDKITPFAVSLISKQMKPMEEMSTTTLFVTLSKIETPLSSAEINSEIVYKKKDHTKLEHESTFINSPNKRVSFDLMSGYLFGYSDRYFYTIEDGVISENSLDRLITLATVNIHIQKYNPKLKPDSFLQKLKVFGGIGITPKPVVAGGLGYQFIGGLSLNAGVSGISVDDIKSGDTVGNAPTNDDNPFDPKFRTAYFISLSVKFSN